MTRCGYIRSRSLRQHQRRRLWRRCCEWPQVAAAESESGAKTGLFSSFRGLLGVFRCSGVGSDWPCGNSAWQTRRSSQRGRESDLDSGVLEDLLHAFFVYGP